MKTEYLPISLYVQRQTAAILNGTILFVNETRRATIKYNIEQSHHIIIQRVQITIHNHYQVNTLIIMLSIR